MQKVFRRTVLAEAQAARRLARRKDRYTRQSAKTKRESQLYSQKQAAADNRVSRHVRREDWELGPLAPKRDVGLKKETYGTISTMRLRNEKFSIEERLEMNPEGGRYPNIVAGDRVVLLQGRDKGKIGKITTLDAASQQVTVEGLNMVDVAIPAWMQKAEGEGTNPVRCVELPMSIQSVRLVFPLPDPETGITRDVIVAKVVNGNVFHDRHTGRKRWTRFIGGMDVVIPWPKTEPKEHKDFDCDTLRLDVESRTFVSSLLKPPMPSTVIDELRNKYSIFRVRHDEEYLQAKMQEDQEAEAQKQSAKEMLTPMKERRKEERKMLKSRGRPKMTEDMLARIGVVMARKRSMLTPASETLIEHTA